MSGRARWLALAAVIVGCVPDEEQCEAEETRTGDLIDFFAFGHGSTDLYCEAGFEEAESHARWVAEAWGQPPREVAYGLFTSRDHPCWSCNSASIGCAFGDSVAATTVPHRHELAHSVRGLPCPGVLEEGWAMLYGDPFVEGETLGDLRAAVEAGAAGALPGEYYFVAARFVAFLLENYGVEALAQTCELSTSDVESLDAAFVDVYGQSLEELLVAFEEYPAWTMSELRQDQACEDESVPAPFGEAWTLDLTCGADGVEGRRDDRLIAHQLVEVPADGHFRYWMESPIGLTTRVELRSCDRAGLASVFQQTHHVYPQAGSKTTRVVMDAPAGVYVLRVMALEAESVPDNLELTMGLEAWP